MVGAPVIPLRSNLPQRNSRCADRERFLPGRAGTPVIPARSNLPWRNFRCTDWGRLLPDRTAESFS